MNRAGEHHRAGEDPKPVEIDEVAEAMQADGAE